MIDSISLAGAFLALSFVGVGWQLSRLVKATQNLTDVLGHEHDVRWHGDDGYEPAEGEVAPQRIDTTQLASGPRTSSEPGRPVPGTAGRETVTQRGSRLIAEGRRARWSGGRPRS